MTVTVAVTVALTKSTPNISFFWWVRIFSTAEVIGAA